MFVDEYKANWCIYFEILSRDTPRVLYFLTKLKVMGRHLKVNIILVDLIIVLANKSMALLHGQY